ncbi:MAG: hypothetical protein ETSY2_39920 [Candidatus Entotheonella gemina]|uniref:Uncharacterized protein n=1 Tax=Candidatus Entotheonella gemina TaxID=1429439 RepID=W4LRE9_9BACT|nr:MAG: hypothetical protein ETSY2_39920 [Candidatus Entotheonella gemina]
MMGFETSISHFLPIYKSMQNKSMIKGTLILAFVLPQTASLIIGGLLFVTSDWSASHLFQKPQLSFVIKSFACALPFYILMLICASYARGFRQMKRYNSLLNLIQPVAELLMVAGLFLVGYRLGGTILGFGLSAVVAAGVGVYWIVKMFQSMELSRVPATCEVGKQLTFTFSTLMIGVVHILIMQTDRLMLGVFSSAHDVGIFMVATLISQKARFFLQSTNSIFPPVISDLYHQGRIKELVSTYKSVTWIITALTVPLIITFCFMSSEIVFIFGSEYTSASQVMIILSLAQLINVLVGSCGFILVMTGKQKVEAINSWSVALLNIILNYLLIPRYGAAGAAIATGMSIGIINIIRLIEIYNYYGYHPYKFSYIKLISSSVIAVAFIIVMKSLFDLNHFLNMIIVILSIIIYFCAVYKLGVDEEEKALFLLLKEKLVFRKKNS